MSRILSTTVGAFVEAWQEVRIHKTRVMLSLIGVAVAVCAITTVVGVGAVAQQATVEQAERSSGRPESLVLQVSTTDGSSPDTAAMRAVWSTALERYQIGYASRVTTTNQSVQFTDGVANVTTMAVDQPYGTMHRISLTEGNWFTETDAARLAPAVIVNSIFYDRLGHPPLAEHPTTTLIGERITTAVITGVYPSQSWETDPAMYLLTDALATVTGPVSATPDPSAAAWYGPPSYELWVPPELADSLTTALQRDVSAAMGEGVQADIYRQDYASFGDDPFLPIKLLVGGVAGLVLLLGALGLVNIALVTLAQRIREIGIRRSFGATAGRVFVAVMLESVVATVVAGIVGVIVAVLIVKNPLMEQLIGQGQVTDFPPFPVEAAVLGLVCATAVGALAGLVPAIIAVRVKVIDAIRF